MTQNDMPGTVRALLRGLDRASLATALPGEAAGWPYASLVLVAIDHDLSPILLMSDLAAFRCCSTAPVGSISR
jgi:hypothetical protein